MTDSPAPQPSSTPDEAPCILCGRCLAVCPLFAATQQEELSPRAKKFLLQELDKGEQGLSARSVQALAGLCLGCERCLPECPQGVDVPRALARLKERHPGWKGWVWKQVMTRAGTVWPLMAQWGSRVSGLLPEARQRQVTALRPQTVIDPWIRVQAFDTCGAGQKVLLFPGCTGRYTRPAWNEKARALLAGTGYEVLPMPDWGCCGHTLGLAGLAREQRAMQARNLSLWRDAGRPLITAYCATCLTGLERMAEADLGWNKDEPGQWRASLTPLVMSLGTTTFQVEDAAPKRVVLHRPCHSKDVSAAFGPLGKVVQDSGTDVIVLDDCCGLGGSMQLEAPGLSRRVAGRFWDRLGMAEGQVLTGCSGCVLQLTATAPEGVVVGHWLDALAVRA